MEQELFPGECHHGLSLKEVCYDCERENDAANLQWEAECDDRLLKSMTDQEEKGEI